MRLRLRRRDDVVEAYARGYMEKTNKRINKAEWKITDVIDALLTVSSIALTADDQDIVRDKLSRKYTGDELDKPVGPVNESSAIYRWPPVPKVMGFTGEEIELIGQVAMAVRDGKPVSLLSSHQRSVLANIITLCCPSVTIVGGK